MGPRKQVTALAGQTFEVDTSVEACKEFGFRPNDRVRASNGMACTVVGVAPMPIESVCVKEGENMLWVAPDGRDDGRVCFFPDPTENLKKIVAVTVE